MRICTNNYELRNLKSEDTQGFYELAHDSSVKKYVPYAYCGTYEEAKELMWYYEKGDCKNDFYLGIFKENDLIGSIIANKVNQDTLEICTLVLYQWRGKGVMTEAMNGFIKWLGQNTSYEKLNFAVEKTNIPSIKQIEKIKGELYSESSLKNHNFYRVFIRKNE